MRHPDPELPFDQLSSVPPSENGKTQTSFPDRWQQGRGCFGGLVTAVMVRALEQTAPDRPLRSLTAELFGPVQPGETLLSTEVLRAGSGMTTSSVRLSQGAETLAHAVGVLGKPRVELQHMHLTPPTMPAFESLEPLQFMDMGPAFAEHGEYRVAGPYPFSGAQELRVEGWFRWKRPGAKGDVAFLASCVDSFWPAFYSVWSEPRPIATVAFTFQPLAFEVDPAEPVYYRASLPAAVGGYGVEFREVWSRDGRLLALNQQTIAVIK